MISSDLEKIVSNSQHQYFDLIFWLHRVEFFLDTNAFCRITIPDETPENMRRQSEEDSELSATWKTNRNKTTENSIYKTLWEFEFSSWMNRHIYRIHHCNFREDTQLIIKFALITVVGATNMPKTTTEITKNTKFNEWRTVLFDNAKWQLIFQLWV